MHKSLSLNFNHNCLFKRLAYQSQVFIQFYHQFKYQYDFQLVSTITNFSYNFYFGQFHPQISSNFEPKCQSQIKDQTSQYTQGITNAPIHSNSSLTPNFSHLWLIKAHINPIINLFKIKSATSPTQSDCTYYFFYTLTNLSQPLFTTSLNCLISNFAYPNVWTSLSQFVLILLFYKFNFKISKNENEKIYLLEVIIQWNILYQILEFIWLYKSYMIHRLYI